uniref:ELYS-like domain-containing protein n=1 Tax=Knipowitschia caucasica TaxID=637954 RepID=A0AAV2JGZ3_KNICA
MLLELEAQWTDLLATNNIVSIIHGLRKNSDNDNADVDETLVTFSCWLQRTSEITKKELLSLCLSRGQGLWMFFNRYSCRRVRFLLQKLRNLLTLVHWVRRTAHSARCHEGKDIPLSTRRSCWPREQRDLQRHLWLGRLVEWWSLMGLLPKRPEPQGEKKIAQMWKEMRSSLDTSGRLNDSLIFALMTHLQPHSCPWSPESSGQPCYPPPSLKALLKLLLLPHADSQSVQGVFIYFILDIAKILQCKNDLYKSFCDTFSIPSSFSSQIRAFWMLDHGQVKTALEVLLSPRTALPRCSWQHRCIIKSLLWRKEHQMALRYMHLTNCAAESEEDVKLGTDVWLQNNCVSEAWALVKRNHTEKGETLEHFSKTCNECGFSAEASKYIPSGYEAKSESDNEVAALHLKEPVPCPLSALVYQAQREGVLSPELLLQLLTQAVRALTLPSVCTLREFTWPQTEHTEAKAESSEVFLSIEVPCVRSPSPSILEPRSEDYQDHQSFCTSPLGPAPGRRHVSFSSVSSLSPVRKDPAFSYESTVTLQQISALLIHDPGEEEDLSQAADESHERPPEGAVFTPLEQVYSQHRFYSTDCVSDLPSLPEEIIQTPTKCEKPKDNPSGRFQESEASLCESVQRDELQKCDDVEPPAEGVSSGVLLDHSEAAHMPDAALPISTVGPRELLSFSLLPYMPPPHHEGNQGD